MYPLKFKPILKSTLWGGERIIPFKQLDCQQEQVGKSWEISDITGRQICSSRRCRCRQELTQLMEEYKKKNWWEKTTNDSKAKFLCLSSLLTPTGLSIQVHP